MVHPAGWEPVARRATVTTVPTTGAGVTATAAPGMRPARARVVLYY